MNCGDFRYLIQRRFDVELSPQDDRALLIHLETCDSCQKFYHQVQQVIVAAEELELSEELLPPTPDTLFANAVANIPAEKPGLKNIFMSLLERIGILRKSESENQIPNQGGLLPRSSETPLRRQTIRPTAEINRQAQITSHPLVNWEQGLPPPDAGQAAEVFATEQSFGAGQSASADHIPIQDQVSTRSLGEKFGISGVNNPLNNKQGLSLAESIRQKISEMSKTNVEYDTPGPITDPSFSEPIDEWTIPDSPHWPKLNGDTSPEQWTDQNPGSRAPNAWGNTIAGWESTIPAASVQSQPQNQFPATAAQKNIFNQPIPSSQFQPSQFQQVAEQLQQVAEQSQSVYQAGQVIDQPQLTHQIEETPPKYQPEQQQKMPSWSTQAEQLETGNWQTVQLDTTLGASGYSSRPPLPTMPPPSANIPAMQTPSVQPAISAPQPAQPAQPIPFPLENFPQMYENQISPIFSSQSQNIDIFAQPVQPPQSEQLKENKASEDILENLIKKEATMVPAEIGAPPLEESEGPKIYPVMSKKAQKSSTPIATGFAEPNIVKPNLVSPDVPAKPRPSASMPAISLPIPSPPPPPVSFPAAQSPNVALTKQTSFTVPASSPVSSTVAEDEASRLFNFDDHAIDNIFSNNLGVHERSVPTQSNQQQVPPSIPEPTIAAPSTSFNQAQQFLNIPVGVTNIPAGPTIFSPPPLPPPIEETLPVQNEVALLPQIPPAIEASKTEADVNNLFAVDDNLIDRIFTDTLGVPEHVSKNVVGSPKNIPDESMISTTAIKENISTPMETPPTSFESEIFSKPQSFPEPVSVDISPVTAANNIPPSAGQISSSGYSSGRQKIVGVGKLDTRREGANDPGSGRIASIGKFLLDNKDLEKIGKITASDLSDSKMRTLTLEANEELKNLLSQIDKQDGVTGTVIVGHDGLLIANTMSAEMDPESLGVWALGVYMGTAHVVEKLGDDNVRQIVSQTSKVI